MWLVLLESANDQFLGVDPSEQLVTSYVWYGTTLLLIRNTIRSVSCSIAWGRGTMLSLGSTWCKGVCVGETIALQAGLLVRKL
jgi:hypothetical protein